METAKVDLRKLQLLNDRINQTLDALNQLRVSVHGLQHSGIGQVPTYAAGVGYGVDPRIAAAYAMVPNATQFAAPQFPGTWASQFAASPQIPWMNQAIGGISHTGIEALVDPYGTVRAAQTFPYLFSPVSPVAF